MFRFNNPDALLTLLLTGAAYATVRAVEAGRTRWMVLAGTLIGFGFITKMLQAVILLPVLVLVYLLAGPPKLGRRLVQVRLRRGGHGRSPGAGGWRPSSSPRRPTVPTSGAPPTTTFSTSSSATTGSAGSPATRREASVGAGAPGQHVGPGRVGPPVPPPDGRPDLVADPGRAHRLGGRALADPPRPAHRPGPRRVPHLRRMAAPHRGHPQLRPGDHPSVLHRRPGPGRRRPGRHGRDDLVVAPAGGLPAPRPGGGQSSPPSSGHS